MSFQRCTQQLKFCVQACMFLHQILHILVVRSIFDFLCIVTGSFYEMASIVYGFVLLLMIWKIFFFYRLRRNLRRWHFLHSIHPMAIIVNFSLRWSATASFVSRNGIHFCLPSATLLAASKQCLCVEFFLVES